MFFIFKPIILTSEVGRSNIRDNTSEVNKLEQKIKMFEND